MTGCGWARICSQRHDLITKSYEVVDIFCLCILSSGHYRDEDKGNVGGIINNQGSARTSIDPACLAGISGLHPRKDGTVAMNEKKGECGY
jgi:hypothetical protein